MSALLSFSQLANNIDNQKLIWLTKPVCCSYMYVINKVLLDNEKKIRWKISLFNVGLTILKVLKDNKLPLLHIILCQM